MAIRRARDLLEFEAARARAFGTYRIIVTTDGEADDGQALTSEIEDLARTTPIQVATIGIGIGGRHVLRRAGLASFVDVGNVNQLAEALKAAIAESQNFDPSVTFEEG
jgi:predicted NBD/HSP70 family sugar kinase